MKDAIAGSGYKTFVGIVDFRHARFFIGEMSITPILNVLVLPAKPSNCGKGVREHNFAARETAKKALK
jgi:hypothetical protein